MQFFSNLTYYGLESEDYHELRDQIAAQNCFNNQLISGLTLLLLCAFDVIPRIITNRMNDILAYAVLGTLLAALFIISRRFCAKREVNPIFATTICIITFFCLFYIGLQISVLSNPNTPAVTYVTALLCVQMFMITPFYVKLLLNLLTTAIFFIVVSFYKIPEVAALDYQNITVATAAALILNWQYSRVHCEGLHYAYLLKQQSLTDELSGIGNRRYFFAELQRHMAYSNKLQIGGCVAMLDIDSFKTYNDNYGHPAGDVVIRKIGELLEKFSKEHGFVVSRIGGEEFAILWDERRTATIYSTMLELHKAIHNLNIKHEYNSVAPYITVSMGLCIIAPKDKETSTKVYNDADLALYHAKQNGRNRIMQSMHGGESFIEVTRELCAQLQEIEKQLFSARIKSKELEKRASDNS